MRLTDIKEHNVTDEEFDVLNEMFDGISDFCEMCNGTWGIEWDGPYGRHWETFETEEQAQFTLDIRSDAMVAALPEARATLAARKEAKRLAGIVKANKKRALREAKTLGGQHPELQALLVQMRNERRSA